MENVVPGLTLERSPWNARRKRYRCADGRAVTFPRQAREARLEAVHGDAGKITFYLRHVAWTRTVAVLVGPWSGVFCRAAPQLGLRLAAVSGTMFDRGMTTVVGSPDWAKTLALPRTVRRLCQRAFHGCMKLRCMRLNEGLEVLGNECFSYVRLARVHIPASVREVQENAFSNCYELAQVAFAEGSRCERIGVWAFGNTNLETFQAPAALQKLGGAAFFGCRRLRFVALNEGLETIDMHCFQNSGLRRVTIPASVREIGEDAFKGWFVFAAVEFAPGSRLKRAERMAFAGTRMKKTAFPARTKAAPDPVRQPCCGQ